MSGVSHRIWYLANLANLLAMACHMAAPLLSVYWRQSGFADWQLGWLAAGFSSAAILCRLGLGGWLERFGRKPFMVGGSLLLTATPGFFPFLFDHYGAWLAVRVAQGLGLGLYFTTILTWVADNSPPDQVGRLQGMFGISGLLGSAVGPYLLEFVYKHWGFLSMFRVLFGLGLACVILVSRLPESQPQKSAGGSTSGSNLNPRAHPDMIAATLPFGWLVGTIMTFIGPYLAQIGLPEVGLYYCGFAAASVGIRMVASNVLDEFRVDRLVLLSGLIMALSGLTLSTLALAPHLWLLGLASLLNGVGHGFLYPSLSSYMVRSVAGHQRGGGLALFTATFDLGVLSGAVASGYLCQSFGYPASFRLASLLLALGVCTFALMSRPQISTERALPKP